jgi:hypothetical protein
MRFNKLICIGIIAAGFAAPAFAEFLPAVEQITGKSLDQVGSGTYRKLGFTVYRATLWAPRGRWNDRQPYALQLRYAMDLSKSTLVDTVVDNIREQGVDDTKIAAWKEALNDSLPEVKKDDEIIGVSAPGKESRLFLNGEEIARIEDQELSDAFFNIWLGNTANKKLQSQLLAGNRQQASLK